MLVSRLLLLVDLNSTIHSHFPSCIMCKSVFFVWKRRAFRACVQAIVRWPSEILTSWCAKRILVVGQILVALRWRWPVCVPLRWFQGWLFSRSLLGRGRIREGFFDAWRHLDEPLLPETCPLPVVLRLSFSPLNFGERFSYWAHDSCFELRLPCHAWEMIAGWHNV